MRFRPGGRVRRLVPVCAALAGTALFAGGAHAQGLPLQLPVQLPSPLAPKSSKPPVISGSPVQGATLVSTTGTWSGTGRTYSYRWQRCRGATCVFVPAATTRRYRLTAADVSRRLRIFVTATNPFGSATRASALTATVRSAFQVKPAPEQPAKKPAKTKLKRLPARITIKGRLTATGARITAFTVRTRRGARLSVRCRDKGKGCPPARARRAVRTQRFRLRSLERSFPAGVVIELRLTKRNTIGRYMRLRIRAGRVPARMDRCLKPGRRKPLRCP